MSPLLLHLSYLILFSLKRHKSSLTQHKHEQLRRRGASIAYRCSHHLQNSKNRCTELLAPETVLRPQVWTFLCHARGWFQAQTPTECRGPIRRKLALLLRRWRQRQRQRRQPISASDRERQQGKSRPAAPTGGSSPRGLEHSLEGVPGGGVLGGLTALFSASSSQGGGDSDVDGDVEEANEPELGEARAVGTASEASSSSATAASGGGVLGGASSSSRSAGDRGDRNVAVDAGAGEVGGGSAIAVGPGISWVTLTAVVASQVAFVGLFGWISSSAIRECNRMKVLNIKLYDLHT